MLILIGVVRIILTYPIFWQTWDEPYHLASGMEWLIKGERTAVEQPPLAQVSLALGPFLAGVRPTSFVEARSERDGQEQDPFVQNILGKSNPSYEGNALLHFDQAYERNLTLARIGVLPFFILTTVAVWVWALRLDGRGAGFVAVLLLTTLPPVLAHSGVATVDMAVAAMLTWALFAFYLWLSQPNPRNSVFLGFAVGLAILSKFSAVVFLPAAGCLFLVLRLLDSKLVGVNEPLRIRHLLRGFALSLLIAFLTIWAGYRFSLQPLVSSDQPHKILDHLVGTKGSFHDVAYLISEKIPVPAPEFLRGLQAVLEHNKHGHLSYFMGEIRTHGWWNYFPVLLLVKTPLPFLALSNLCVVILAGRTIRRETDVIALAPAMAAASVLLMVIPSHINIGLRHVLPIYPFLVILAAHGVTSLWRLHHHKFLARVIVITLLSVELVSSFGAHPDYLPYFNILAGDHPEIITVESDLDMGQDLKRLQQTLTQRKISRVSLRYFGSADLDTLGLPARVGLIPYTRTPGWVAISVHDLRFGTWTPPYDQYAWLDSYEPVKRIGKSILLYNIPNENHR